MKSRESAIRLRRFEAQEKVRKVQGLEQMIRDFEVMAVDLERQVQAEEDRTGVKDVAHFAYSTFAKAASQRRDKLRASIEDLRVKLEDAIRERDETNSEVKLDGEAQVRDAQNREAHARDGHAREAVRGRRRMERSAPMMSR
jgi:flagellar protein FliJ